MLVFKPVSLLIYAFWGFLIVQTPILDINPMWQRFLFLPAIGAPVLAILILDANRHQYKSKLDFKEILLLISTVFGVAPSLVLVCYFVGGMVLALIAYPFGYNTHVAQFIFGNFH